MPKNFLVYADTFSGSFNIATRPYSDVPSSDPLTDLKSIRVHTDNGMSKLYDTPELNNLVGQHLYSENKASVILSDQPRVLAIAVQNAFFFPTGTINGVGSFYNQTDEDGVRLPNSEVVFNIVGGVGEFLNVKGIIIMRTKINPYIQSYEFVFE